MWPISVQRASIKAMACVHVRNLRHVLISCRNYDCQRQDLLRDLQEIGLEEVSLKSVLEVGSSRRGKCCFFKFIKDTGLFNRIKCTKVLVP